MADERRYAAVIGPGRCDEATSEIGLAGVVGRPVVVVAGWRLEHATGLPNGIEYAQTAAAAVQLAVRLAPS